MRQEFPTKVKVAAFQRSNGACENCTAKLFPGNIRYDHAIADGLGGQPTVENCAVLCRTCHDVKTAKHDAPAISRAKRRERNSIGAKDPSPRGFKAWRKFNNDPVYRGKP